MKYTLWTFRPDGLRDEIKASTWATQRLQAPRTFVHGSGKRLNEISANESSEWVTAPNNDSCSHGRFVFAFALAGRDGANLPLVNKSVRFLFGTPPYLYVFTAPAGTWYACVPGGGLSAEVAFPYVIEAADITEKWQWIGGVYQRW